MGSNFEFIKNGEELIDKIEKKLHEEDGVFLVSEDKLDFLNFTGEKFDDYLTLFILRTFFMKKQHKINWNDAEVKRLEGILLDNPENVKNQQLRISLLSYLILMTTLSKERKDYSALLSRLDQELKLLSSSKKSLPFTERQLLLNKAVILIHMEKYNEANKIIK